MNFTIDQVNSWADKLTYRLMVMIGVSDQDLQNYLAAIQAKQEGVSNADAALSPPVTIFGMTFKNIGDFLLKAGLAIVGVVLLWHAYKNRNKR
jgi:hypothetical protein